MKILIVPDTHQKINKLDKILQNNSFDELVSLGDMFDDFYDTPEHSVAMAEYILKLYSLYGDRFTWIMGNHDIPYLYPAMYDFYACSGTTRQKAKAIREVFKTNMGYKPVLAKTIKIPGCFDIVLSHAGVSEHHFGKPFVDEITSESVEKECGEAMTMLEKMRTHSILQAGLSRGGRALVGGITWLDWYDEFVPIKNLSQIVGHTPTSFPKITDGYNVSIQQDEILPSMDRYILKEGVSYNINLDTHLENYITIENNELNIHKASVLFD